jgi:glutathione peroxidase
VLYDEYRDRGFAVLGFPCDQFAHQEPGDDEEIRSFCTLKYGVNFPLYSKIDVNGRFAHPLFRWLRMETKSFLTDRIKWNFTKFLVDREGNPVKRYGPNVEPSELRRDIERVLAADAG